MDTQLKEGIMGKWLKYFPEQEMPIAVFYADDLHGSELAEKPKENPRGYTCMFAQLAKVHRGRSVALSKDNLGCWGAIENLFGGPYIEDATVKLLVEIEKFKKDREHVNALQTINPKAKPTGKYAIFKPFSQLTEDDEPEIFCIFAKPDVIAALHTLASFDNTRIDNVIVPFGSGCEQTFKFAFSEALQKNPRAVLGGMDVAMRGCMKSELQTFSIAAVAFYHMSENMDACFLNTYIWEGLKRRLSK